MVEEFAEKLRLVAREEHAAGEVLAACEHVEKFQLVDREEHSSGEMVMACECVEKLHLAEAEEEHAAGEVRKERECAAEKRGREEGNVEGRHSKCQKQKVEESLEEVKTEGASPGQKVFGSSTEMYQYFLKLVHSWSTNLDLNKYEHLVLPDLLKKGHPESTIKIGEGIKAFQVRHHPIRNTRCFFLIRVDGSSDAFSFCKCIDKILPLPSHVKVDSSSGNSSGNRNSTRGGR